MHIFIIAILSTWYYS